MSNDLIFPPLILVCPADQSKHPVENWTSFSAQNHSYEIVNPGIPKTDTNRVFLRCPIHGYTGYADNRLLDPSGQLVRKRSW